MQANRIGRLACAFVLTFLAGCRSEPRPEASAAPAGEAPAPSLTPLTSQRGEVAPPVSLPPEQGLPPGHPPLSDPPPPGMESAGGSIAGVVDVATEHKGRMTGGALFLIARNAKTRQIVAVRREESLRFPIRFQLSGADAMVQGTAFEGPLDVTVRWSQAGDAMPAPGDIEATARGVAVGATNLSLKLTDVRK